MKSLFVLVSSLIFLSGCATSLYPLASPDAAVNEGKRAAAEFGPVGYLGITAQLDLQGISGTPVLKIVVKQKESGKKFQLVAEIKKDLQTGTGLVPLLFSLPTGEFSVEGGRVQMPGVVIGDSKFPATTRDLELDAEAVRFQIAANQYFHLLKLAVKISQASVAGGEKVVSSGTVLTQYDRPTRSTWSRFLPMLGKMDSYYRKKTVIGKIEQPKIDWTRTYAFLDVGDGENVVEARVAGRTRSDIQKTTKSLTPRMEICRRKLGPQAAGRLEIRYEISPDGVVRVATVEKNTFKTREFVECALREVKSLRFSPHPDDDYEAWNSVYELQ